ncbi:MAG: adenylate/guanylate cyclase domain-containing protein [Treponemataceae bacterium]
MNKSGQRKLFCLGFLFFAAVGLWAQNEPIVGAWSRLSASAEKIDFSINDTVISLDRLRPFPSFETVSFSTRVSSLESGSVYAITLPYAAYLSVSSQKRTDMNGSSGASLIMVATGPEIELIASVSPGVIAPELSLRGFRVQSIAEASFALVGPWLLLTLLFAFSVTRVFFGLAVALRDRTRMDESFFALASIASLLLIVAMFRYVSAVYQSFFSAEIETLLRALGGIIFPVAAIGCISATKPFKASIFIFIGVALIGVLAAVAVFLTFIPPLLPMAALNAVMVPTFVIIAAVSFANRRRYDGVLAILALLGSAALCLSAVLTDPLFEAFTACAAPLPILIVSLRSRLPDVRAIDSANPEPVLSDYVDQVSIALTRFVPKEFLAILDKDNAFELKLGDHIKKDMTIFFSDIRSFTTLSEGLTPEENFKFINSYLARVVPVVTEHGGFVDKYIGDAIMALFPNEGGADSAVRSAIEMQKRIVEYNGHRANCGYRPLSMGIGLHTGTLMLGVVGIEDRMQSTVISDAVNLASRLESITKVFNVSLAISEETFKSLADPGAYMYRFIGKVRVKGKFDPVSVFEIFDGINEEIFERKMKANRFFEQGMLAYYQKDFSGAMFYFRKVLEILPEDGAATFYLDNCLTKVRV